MFQELSTASLVYPCCIHFSHIHVVDLDDTLTGPNLGYSVSEQGGTLDVLGAASDLHLKAF